MDPIRIHFPRWKVGDRIEAKDFMNVWYPSKVIAYDEKEDAILVHFEGWNQRFDEWFPSNSEKVRHLSWQSANQKEGFKISSTKFLSIGQYVMAPWKDGENYPGKIRSINLRQRKYKVSFLDGATRNVSFRKVCVMSDEEIKELNYNLGTSDTFSFSTDTASIQDDENDQRPSRHLERSQLSSETDEPLRKIFRLQGGKCNDNMESCYSPDFSSTCDNEESSDQNNKKMLDPLNDDYKYLPHLDYEDFIFPKSLQIVNSLFSLQKMLKNSERKIKLVKKKLDEDEKDSTNKILSDCEIIKSEQITIEDTLNEIEKLVDNFSESFEETENT